jgi:hypothetical protein
MRRARRLLNKKKKKKKNMTHTRTQQKKKIKKKIRTPKVCGAGSVKQPTSNPMVMRTSGSCATVMSIPAWQEC